MKFDLRHNAAFYYDRFSKPPGDDVRFYINRLPKHCGRVLELGCGTGRVLAPVAQKANYSLGVDLSPAMLDLCQSKLEQAGLYPARARTMCADITKLDLTQSEAGFDRICAPFRVMQNLATDEQVDGLMQVIRRHLKPGGEAVLNTFRPRGGYEALASYWAERDGTKRCWTHSINEDTVIMSDDCRTFGRDPVCVYPKLIYRRHNALGKLIDEAVMDIVMRVWQPDELLELIESHGFQVTEKLGGYDGEAWDAGPELIVGFTLAD